MNDRAWLLAALTDALDGRIPVLPTAEGVDPEIIADLQQTALPDGTAVVIRTSGSSGVPKSVALSAEALRASAEATHETLGGPGQWLVALPGHLISGLQMLVRSIVAGIDPVFVVGSDPEAFFAAADRMEAPRRYVSLVPVQLSRLLDHAEAANAAGDRAALETLQSFDAVLVGGQAITLELRRCAHEHGIELRRSYGMTETSGGCVYDGVEIGDTRVRVRDGEVQLAGTALALGYVGDPELTDARFIDDQGTRWYRTGDAGSLLGGMLTVTGRLDRVVISGGVNVSLDEVERVVREFPGWGSAVALGMSDPEWGERPALAVEIEGGAAAFDDVRAAVQDRLGAAAAPLWATETEQLPRLAGGKPDLQAIEEWLRRLRSSFSEIRGTGRHGVADDGSAGVDTDRPQQEPRRARHGA